MVSNFPLSIINERLIGNGSRISIINAWLMGRINGWQHCGVLTYLLHCPMQKIFRKAPIVTHCVMQGVNDVLL